MTRRQFLALVPSLLFLLTVNPSLLLSRQPSSIIIDLDTAKLLWNWELGSGGTIEWFEISCGGNTVRINDAAARSYPLKDVVSKPGFYDDCAIVAGNTSARSATMFFPPFEARPARTFKLTKQVTAHR